MAQQPDPEIARLEAEIKARTVALVNHFHLRAAEALFEKRDANLALELLNARASISNLGSERLQVPVPLIDEYAARMFSEIIGLLEKTSERYAVLAEIALQGRDQWLRDPEQRRRLDPSSLGEQLAAPRGFNSDPTTALAYLQRRQELLKGIEHLRLLYTNAWHESAPQPD